MQRLLKCPDCPFGPIFTTQLSPCLPPKILGIKDTGKPLSALQGLTGQGDTQNNTVMPHGTGTHCASFHPPLLVACMPGPH